MKKAGVLSRLISVAMIASMLLSLLPAGAMAGSAGTGASTLSVVQGLSSYVRTTVKGVNLREAPERNAKSLNEKNQIGAGEVFFCYQVIHNDNYDWAMIVYDGMNGYIRGDCFAYCDVNGNILTTPEPTATPLPGAVTPDVNASGYVKANRSSQALYVVPEGEVLNGGDLIPSGQVMPYYAGPYVVNGVNWLRVSFHNMYGYIRESDLTYCDYNGNPLSTTAPDYGTILGYVKLIQDKVKLRATPGGEQINPKDLMPLGKVLPYTLGPITEKGYTWVRVTYNGMTGYVRKDCFVYCDESGLYTTDAPVNPSNIPNITPTPTPVPDMELGFVKSNTDKLILRDAPNGKQINKNNLIPKNNIMPYTALPVRAGGYDWIRVIYLSINGASQIGYVRKDFVDYCDGNGNLLPDVTATPSLSPTGTAGMTGNWGRTTADKVYFRKEASTQADAWAKLPMGWLMEILSTEIRGSVTWYKVRGGTPANSSNTYTGYIHGDFFKPVQTQPTTTAPTYTTGYAMVQLNGLNLRKTPGGDSITSLTSGTIVNVIYTSSNTSIYDWYYVEYRGSYGYLQAAYLWVLSDDDVKNGNFILPPTPAPTVTPSPTPAFTGTGYILVRKDKVNIRKTPDGTTLTGRDADKLRKGTVLPYSEGPTGLIGGYNWVKVTYGSITGYVRSDCYAYCDKNGALPLDTPTPAPTGGTTQQPGGQAYVTTRMGGVNLRNMPEGASQLQLDKGVVLLSYGTETVNGQVWYRVYYVKEGLYGYLMSSMVYESDSLGNPITVTPAPTGSAATGYVATSVSSVWLRSAPAADAKTAGQVKNKGTVVTVTGSAIRNGVYTWYPVMLKDGTRGYLRGDCVFELAQWQLEIYQKTGVCPTPTPGPATPAPGNSSYIRTIADKLYVRKTPSKQAGSLGQLSIGTVTQFYSKKIVGTVTWYEVKMGNTYGYVHGDYARVMTNAEYYDYINKNATPTPAPTSTPDPKNLSDLALTTIKSVNIRAGASMSAKSLIKVSKVKSELTYLGNYATPSVGNEYYWFNVRYNGVSGWIRGDCVRVLTPEEKTNYLKTGNPDASKTASYTVLKKGSTGDAVINLQKKLLEKGYLLNSSDVTGLYDTNTENAVMNFQRQNALNVTGIADENTQHALFGTVPSGGSSVDTKLYPVEIVDWYTGDIQSVWRAGTVAVITDVYTGLSFKAQRLYGDNHADCEPLTSADTDVYCQIYGVSDPQEISDHEKELQSWRRRPLWVTVGGRTFCASLYGVPHNFKGDKIPDNDFNGQFCVHFKNSRTHNSNVVDTGNSNNGNFGHQDAIQYAYTHSISGTK